MLKPDVQGDFENKLLHVFVHISNLLEPRCINKLFALMTGVAPAKIICGDNWNESQQTQNNYKSPCDFSNREWK